jgi:DNA-binding MarR family transcriptional regulator
MHAGFFGLKRAFHGTLRITRSALGRLGLTAARFDLLYAVLHGSGELGGRTLQSDLRRKLGVSRPTVSRMLSSIEELGLIRRERDRFDTRQLLVKLTAHGRAVIRRAEGIFVDGGWSRLAIEAAFERGVPGCRWNDSTACFLAMDALDHFLTGMRIAFEDSATLYYPWHPDD